MATSRCKCVQVLGLGRRSVCHEVLSVEQSKIPCKEQEFFPFGAHMVFARAVLS